MEQPVRPHPLPHAQPLPPKLELVHDASEGEDPELSAAIEEEAEATELVQEDEVEEEESPAYAVHTSDPLKLYVRQIGDGPLLTVAEERELARRSPCPPRFKARSRSWWSGRST